MEKVYGIHVVTVSVTAIVLLGSLVLATRAQAMRFLSNPREKRPALVEHPGLFGMDYESVSVTTEDGLVLYGWYIPGHNGATVMLHHGYPGGRQDCLYEAAFLNHHGYNVLMGSFRSHDESEGERVSYGYHEVKDIAAWHQYLLNRNDVDPGRIGLFGESMGGVTGILYAAENPGIQALVTSGAAAVTHESAEELIEYELHTPHWLTHSMSDVFLFWAEQELDTQVESIDTASAIGRISPRPVLIIHGGNENRIKPENAQRLFDAAAQPKELWFVPEAGHVNFETFRPQEYEQRVVAFFDQTLLNERALPGSADL